MTLWMPKKKPLYAPMLATFGGGSVRGFNPGATGDNFPVWNYSSPTTIQNASLDSQQYQSAENYTTTGIFFSETGDEMYLTMYGDSEIHQYDLSTSWDPSSASYNSKVHVFSEDDNGIASYIKPDGTTLYMTSYGSYNKNVWQYSMSTPWDISTLSYSNKSLVPANAHDATGIFMSRDGTRVFLSNYSSGLVRQHDLSTAWDISTAGTTHSGQFSVADAVSDTGGGWYEMWMPPDGSELWCYRSTADYIYRLSLSTDWDITTASYGGFSNNRINIGSYNNPNASGDLPTAYGFYVKPDGSKLYTVHYSQGYVHRFSF